MPLHDEFGNPFAGPSKHERGLPSRGYTLFKYVFFLPKSSTSDATVGKSSPCIQ
jgi:hypothetical protein